MRTFGLLVRERRAMEPDMLNCIWQNPAFGRLTYRQKVLYIGLLYYADGFWRVNIDTAFIKAMIFSYDHIKMEEIEEDLNRLEQLGLIYRLETDEGYAWLPSLTWREIVDELRRLRFSDSMAEVADIIKEVTETYHYTTAKHIPDGGGVYFLWHNPGVLVYIGSTTNFRNRILHHVSNGIGGSWSYYSLIYCSLDDLSKVRKLEGKLIARYRPILNRAIPEEIKLRRFDVPVYYPMDYRRRWSRKRKERISRSLYSTPPYAWDDGDALDKLLGSLDENEQQEEKKED